MTMPDCFHDESRLSLRSKTSGLLRKTLRFVSLLPLLWLVQWASAQSIVLPINQTMLPDGQIRYSTSISVSDAPPIEAMIDTGSVGLRVLVSAFPDGIDEAILKSDKASHYSYMAGDTLTGIDTHADVGIGHHGDIPIQLVTEVSCLPKQPHCSAIKLAPSNYRIGGNGYTQAGFTAILGIGPARGDGAGLPNPLTALGYRYWTVELPLPNDTKPGRLTLYSTPVPPQPYISMASSQGGYVMGCLMSEDKTSVCAPILFDTGAFGISDDIPNISESKSRRAGLKSRLTFSNSDVPPISFVSGFNGSYARMTERPLEEHGQPRIISGVIVYFHYVILYDGRGRPIGALPRTMSTL
jgi:hypothetical protein